MSNLKPLLAHVWTVVGHLDNRVKNSAILSAVLGVAVGLVLGIPGCFKDDTGPSPPAPTSRAQYAAFVPQFACLEAKHNALELQIVDQLPRPGSRVNDADRVRVFRILADYGRSARQNATEMAKLLDGVRPPPQFTKEHQELVDYAGLLRQLVDELDRTLPANMTLSDQQILADPLLNDRMTRIGQMANAMNGALQRREFSPDFQVMYVCPSLLPRPTATRISITIAIPTISIPAILLSPFPTLGPLGPFSLTPPPGTRTPATTVTPNPFSSILTPVR